MMNFLASLVVSTILTVYIIFAYYLVPMALAISTLFGMVVFIIMLAIAIDFLTKVSRK